jgi:hypothetical protein
MPFKKPLTDKAMAAPNNAFAALVLAKAALAD